MRVGKSRWYKSFMEYLGDVGLTYEEFVRLDRSEVKLRVRNYDN